MSHKTAKKIRRLLKATSQSKEPNGSVWSEREYTEDTKKRKKQMLNTRIGGLEQEVTVSMGQVTLKPGSGRAVYKLVKRVMATGQELPKAQPNATAKPLNIREVEI